MGKRLKKLFAALLSSAVLVSAVPGAVLAAETVGEEPSEAAEVVLSTEETEIPSSEIMILPEGIEVLEEDPDDPTAVPAELIRQENEENQENQENPAPAASGESAADNTAPAAPAEEKIGVIPSAYYKYKITDTDEYIAAVRKTMSSSEDVQSAIDAVKNYVPAVDNSATPYFPEIGSQGGVGSCCSWSNIYYQFTYEMNKLLNRPASSETNFQPLFVHSLLNGGKNGGAFSWDICEMLFHVGCATFATAPDAYAYKNWNANFDAWHEANQYRITSYMEYDVVGRINSRITTPDDSDLAALKATLRNGDIISFTGYVNSYKTVKLKSSSTYNQGEAGKYSVTKQIGWDGCHEMTIVGYNDNIWTDINDNGQVDAGELGAFKVANSHGKTSFDGGFFWMAYDALNTESVVKGIGYEESRSSAMYDFSKLNIDRNFKSSNIYLKYTLNTNNRTDSYIEITATNKADGTKYVKKTAPYFRMSQDDAMAYNFSGEETFSDGTMLVDLDNLVKGLDSNNFHNYTWSFKFVDKGGDTSALTVKEAVVVDETAGKTYQLNASFPFQLNQSSKNVGLKDYYHFSKLAIPNQSKIVLGTSMKIAAKTQNETFGTSAIVYHCNIWDRNGDKVLSKNLKASSTDTKNHTSTIILDWAPKKSGKHLLTLTDMDASGTTISRSVEFTVYKQELTFRSITLDTGKFIGNYEKVKITPFVTGGTAPYTYSYYFVKNNKTYTIAENKTGSRVRQFNTNSGYYKLVVKAKDAKGKVVEGSCGVTVQPTRISRIIYSKEYAQPGENVYVRADVKNMASIFDFKDYEITFTKDGVTDTPPRNPYNDKEVIWNPKSKGIYTVTVSLKYNGKVFASKQEQYEVGVQRDTHAGMKKINVNVITYVCNERPNSDTYLVHYWGGKTGVGDAKVSALNTTKVYNVGFWSTSQTFKQFVAYIPEDATGFKFHIADVGNDRWFGTDGTTATQNTVYAFNYDYDRCKYTKE